MSSATMVSYPAGGVLIASSSMVFRKQVRHSLPDGRWPSPGSDGRRGRFRQTRNRRLAGAVP